MDKYNKIDCDFLNISLQIDDNNKTKIILDINDDVDQICEKISKKYFLNTSLSKKLNYFINSHVIKAKIMNKQKTTEIRKEIIDKCINRLFFSDKESKKLKDQKRNENKYQELQKSSEKFSFTPKLNFFSRLERNYEKIEDKLLKDAKNSIEEKMMRSIKDNLQLQEKPFQQDKKNLWLEINVALLDKKISNHLQGRSNHDISEKKEENSAQFLKKSFSQNKEKDDIKRSEFKTGVPRIKIDRIQQTMTNESSKIKNYLNLIPKSIMRSCNTYKNLYIKNKDTDNHLTSRNQNKEVDNHLTSRNQNISESNNNSSIDNLKKKKEIIKDENIKKISISNKIKEKK